jgi:hypothetical protein
MYAKTTFVLAPAQLFIAVIYIWYLVHTWVCLGKLWPEFAPEKDPVPF